MLAIRLDPETEQRLASLAKRIGRSRASIVREALVERLGDLEDGLTALERLQHPGRIYTSEEVRRAFRS